MVTDGVIKIGGEDYETIPDTAVFASKWLIELWERLGKPDDPFSDAGMRVMNAIIAAWTELYPEEYREWLEDRKRYKNSELGITEQVHRHTGRSLASYPYFVFHAMKIVFPTFKPAQRENCMRMVKVFPLFKYANRA